VAERTYFYLYVEHYVKTQVDFEIILGLSDDAYERFLTKAAIEISRRTSPKQVYGLSREDVREIVHDMINDMLKKKWIVPQKEPLFSFINNVGEPMFIFARFKKDAVSIAKSAIHVSLAYWGKSKSLRKVVEINESGRAVLDNGEEREIGTSRNFVNLYGHGRNYDE